MEDNRATITIPYPQYIENKRGLEASARYNLFAKARINTIEDDILTLAAEHTNLSKANFVRWATMFTAMAILDKDNDGLKLELPHYAKVG